MKKYAQLIVTIINFLVLGALIALLTPSIVPIHFNITGQADSWSSKWVYLIFAFIPLLLEIIYQIYRARVKTDSEHNRPYERLVATVIEFIFIFIDWGLIILVNLGTTHVSEGALALITSLILGATLVIMCNIYGKIKQNRYFGVRTKETLANEQIWNLTNRMAGYIGFAAGIALIIWSLLNYFLHIASPTVSLFITMGTVIVFAAIAPYFIARYYSNKLRGDAR